MISTLIRTTYQCPNNCQHCYIPPNLRSQQTVLTKATLTKILSLLIEVAKLKPTNTIEITWTGGEPLILDANYYTQLGEIIDEIASKHHVKIIESVQTSLLPLTQKHIELFKDRHYQRLATSVDFSQRLLNGSNNHYLQEWLKKIALLRAQNIDFYTTITPTKPDMLLVKDIYDFLLQHHITQTHFSVFIPQKHLSKTIAISNDEQSQFFIDFFNQSLSRLENSEPFIKNQMIAEEICKVIQPLPKQQAKKGCQAGLLVFDPYGNINSCPMIQPPAPYIGHISGGLKELKKSPVLKDRLLLQKIKLNSTTRCLNCEFLPYCKRGCILLNNNNLNDDCAGFKKFLLHIKNYCAQSEKHKALALEYVKRTFREKAKN